MDPQERECGLFIDELNLNAKAEYDQSNGGQQIGWATVGPSVKSKGKSKTKVDVTPNPESVDLNALSPKKMKKEELVTTLQLLGLDSTGNKPILQARLGDYITMNTGENIEDIDLNSLDFKNMKKLDFKIIMGKLGLETIGTKSSLESRLKDYIKMKTKQEKKSFSDGVNENESDDENSDDSEDEIRPPKRRRSPSRDSHPSESSAISGKK